MSGDPGSRRSLASRGPTRLLVSVVDGAGRPLADVGLGRWLANLAPRALTGLVTVVLVSDARIRALNRTYRHTDSSTDVLSFPAEEPGATRPAVRLAPRFWGDIVIATGVARRQARAAGHSVDTELRVLALHGLLHLLGYDHDAPADRGRMARVERRWRKRGGLPAGLIDRADAPRVPLGHRVRARPRRRPRGTAPRSAP